MSGNDNKGKISLLGKTLPELEVIVANLGLPKYTARQVCDWVYKKQVKDFDLMSNLSRQSREVLRTYYHPGFYMPSKVQESVDGTRKFLFQTGEKLFVEAAWIPEANRDTLCVSTQGGCKMGCRFCMTGQQGFQGQLSAGDILNQLLGIPGNEKVSNLVYMGMGEPFDNLEEVLKSIVILTSSWGLAWSPRRVTVSTVGIIPALSRFFEESEAHLAISLHSPFGDERAGLMPVERVYPVASVVEAIRKYDFGRQRRVSFEYIMFEGVNDTTAHVNGITKLLNGLRCRVNLIKFHPVEGSILRGSSFDTMKHFAEKLNSKGVTTTIRKSRGEDILAACGQLSTRELVK